MAAKKIIAQPDILDLESLGAFMDAQQDPVWRVWAHSWTHSRIRWVKAHRRLLHKYCLRQHRQTRSHIPC